VAHDMQGARYATAVGLLRADGSARKECGRTDEEVTMDGWREGKREKRLNKLKDGREIETDRKNGKEVRDETGWG
jgi:hypothetical protein